MKKSTTRIEGKNVKVGDLLVNRLIPVDHIRRIGPFLLLDHSYPVKYLPSATFRPLPNEHPLRGLVAFTYVIKGEIEHFDSLGNHEIAGEGGAHWLSAGSGIIQYERVCARLMKSGGALHAIQFWTNIPAAHKRNPPQYRSLTADAIPIVQLPHHAGIMQVLLGKFGVIESPVESLSQAFLYRIILNAKSECRISIRDEMKIGIFIPENQVIVNGDPAGASQLLILENNSEEIHLRNPGILHADAFILGGPEPTEPIVVQGPFVMNSEKEIADAYRDFFTGNYGRISNTQN
jgi:redox-sensitive bicupin YhaK (pirin superfamily)